MFPALDALAKEHGLSGLFGAYAGCPPLVGTWNGVELQRPCKTFNAAMAQTLANNPVPYVILIGRWPAYVWGYVPGSVERDPPPYAADADSKALSAKEAQLVLERGLDRTRAALPAKTRIVWIDEAPGALQRVSFALAKEMVFPWISSDWRLRSDAARQREAFARTLAESRLGRDIDSYISISDYLCRGTYCQTELNGRPLYSDNHHLAVYGAHKMAPIFEPLFRKIQRNAELRKVE